MPRKTNGRRRLQPALPNLRGRGRPRGSTNRPTPAPTSAPQSYYKPNKRVVNKMNWKTKQRTAARIENSDNIITVPAFKHGVAKKLSFTEKVQRISNPPVIFKRNYQWSAECNSGRKGFFGIEINDLRSSKAGGGGLYEDIMTSAIRRLSTDTSTQDPTVIANSVFSTQQKCYVDYYSSKLNIVNSGSNSVVGKIRLYSYRRDCEALFTNVSVPMTPINLAMFASQNGGNVTIDGGSEGTLGNYGFDALTSGVNYTSNYVMPGSAQNAGGATMNADLAFDLMGNQLKDFVGYFFKLEKTQKFSLKPGQQINHSTIFNDMPIIHRQAVDQTYIRGTSYFMVIEFNAGIVGDSTANNVISTGSGQLSCMLVEKRVLGLVSKNKSKLVMPTTAPAGIAIASQQTINPDTGVIDIGYDDDA